MPALCDLDVRLDADESWRAAYESSLPLCTRVADGLHLLHVAGIGQDGLGVEFAALFDSSPPALPTSEHERAYSAATRVAEQAFGMPHAVYFYAGRAHPEFGSVALAFLLPDETNAAGTATPFDTGGAYHRDHNGQRFIQTSLHDSDDAIIDFCKQSTIELEHWRRSLAQFLAAYFETPRHYWSAPPCRPDPEELHMRNTDWRAWTFEVRLWENARLDWCGAWCADESTMNALASPGLLRDCSVRATRLRQFLRDHPPLKPAGSIDFDLVIESWARESVSV